LNFGKYIRLLFGGKNISRACTPFWLAGARVVSGEGQPRATMDIRADLRNIREPRRRNNFQGAMETRMK